MGNKVILKSTDLDGYLGENDKDYLKQMNSYYSDAIETFKNIQNKNSETPDDNDRKKLIEVFSKMGEYMKEIVSRESRIRVYSFETPVSIHGEASRLIAKLRDVKTKHREFLYYTQRAYELLFNLSLYGGDQKKRHHLIVKTPVSTPVQNYAVHKIPYIDEELKDSVMCVMLRGALLPSIIMSKEIQEYSSDNYITPFALFRIKRDDTKKEHNMEYILDLEKSYFDLDSMNGKDLIFADPMNATGGSFVTIIKYLMGQGIKPRSIKFFNVISSLKGTLRIVRALDNVTVYTLWMDPVMNESAYILPGLGDAGDRLNGADEPDHPRNIIQLIADYGSDISELYRAQIRKIEETVLSAGL